MTTVFYLQIEGDDAFLQIKSSTGDKERKGLPHFLTALDEMLEDEKVENLILDGEHGPVTWGHLVGELHEPIVQQFLYQRGIEVETVWLYPLYRVCESENVSESWPGPESL